MRAHRKHGILAQSAPAGSSTETQAAIVSGDKDHNHRVVSVEDIRLCAYRKWEIAGKPTGEDIQFWLEAEQELGQECR